MHIARPPPTEPSPSPANPASPRAAEVGPPGGSEASAAGGLASTAEEAVAAGSADLRAERELLMATPLADQVHIEPLDIKGAMQILVAEIRAELPLPGDRLPPGDGPLTGDGALPGAGPTLRDGQYADPWSAVSSAANPVASLAMALQTLLLELLQTLPDSETHEPAAWLVAVKHVETAVQVALDKGIATVAAWHDVPSSVVEAARSVGTLVVDALSDDPSTPLWVGPEWFGLAPRMEPFRRRRRYVRRRMHDPDFESARWDDLRGLGDDEADRPAPAT